MCVAYETFWPMVCHGVMAVCHPSLHQPAVLHRSWAAVGRGGLAGPPSTGLLSEQGWTSVCRQSVVTTWLGPTATHNSPVQVPPGKSIIPERRVGVLLKIALQNYKLPRPSMQLLSVRFWGRRTLPHVHVHHKAKPWLQPQTQPVVMAEPHTAKKWEGGNKTFIPTPQGY